MTAADSCECVGKTYLLTDSCRPCLESSTVTDPRQRPRTTLVYRVHAAREMLNKTIPRISCLAIVCVKCFIRKSTLLSF